MICKNRITLDTGRVATTYATFNNGYSHIIIDDGCYQVVNGFTGNAKITKHIFPEAIKILKQLPTNPKDLQI